MNLSELRSDIVSTVFNQSRMCQEEPPPLVMMMTVVFVSDWHFQWHPDSFRKPSVADVGSQETVVGQDH